MHEIPDHDIAQTMQMCGGSFVAQLGKAWMLADPINQQKIKDAFPEYFIEYAELAAMLRRRRAEAPRV